MQNKYCKLVLVEVNESGSGKAAQSNKFYEMTYTGGSSFGVVYGRIESTQTKVSYPYGMWDTKYREKVKKGYKDVTELASVEIVEQKVKPVEYVDIEDVHVAEFITVMKRYTDGLVNKVYSVKSTSVSKKQVDEAQKLLDELSNLAKSKKKDVTLINTRLVELYMVIPRYIKDVRREILPHIDLEKVLSQEQDNLDAMALQVNINKKSEEVKESKTPKKLSILDQLGVTLNKINSSAEVDKYVKQISGMKVKSIFQVDKPRENQVFENWVKNQKNKDTTVVIHGTRCTSVIPILEQGLKIRPSGNFQFSGKVYGNGNYFSEDWNTSRHYTGNDTDKVLLVYEVHVGKPSYNSASNYSEIQRMGYDSFAMKGQGGLHTMRVMYKEEQSRIKYIIWLK
jgi:poly [ADP-ribose] polymerase